MNGPRFSSGDSSDRRTTAWICLTKNLIRCWLGVLVVLTSRCGVQSANSDPRLSFNRKATPSPQRLNSSSPTGSKWSAGGSVPKQIMTSANTVNVLVSADALARKP